MLPRFESEQMADHKYVNNFCENGSFDLILNVKVKVIHDCSLIFNRTLTLDVRGAIKEHEIWLDPL